MESRGIRNSNPGNIRRSATRYRGEIVPSQDAEFKQFESMAYGYRAMFVLIDHYRRRYNLDTIRGIVSRYAPPSENQTAAYIRTMEQLTGIGADARLDTAEPRQMKSVVKAMSRIENGCRAVESEVDEGWRLFAEQ